MGEIADEEAHILGQAFGNYRERPVAPALPPLPGFKPSPQDLRGK
jgi:hypothetical protein